MNNENGRTRKEGRKGKRGNGTHTMICNDGFDAELYNQQQQKTVELKEDPLIHYFQTFIHPSVEQVHQKAWCFPACANTRHTAHKSRGTRP